MRSSPCVMVVGGDGFCGWPLVVRLAREGYQVVIVDSLFRRKLDRKISTSLAPIYSISERVTTLRRLTKAKVHFYKIDVAQDPIKFRSVVQKFRPVAVVDFGKQRSAPFSMLNFENANFTVMNNVLSTNSILTSLVSLPFKPLLIHLGTMGVYGYNHKGRVPEGFNSDGHLLPSHPGSVYHLTKCQDQLSLEFYSRNYGLKIIELHQGIVWGYPIQDVLDDRRLATRFDCDGEFGTVINRFVVQKMLDVPLTIYGRGQQQRAFIHIDDMVANIVEILKNNKLYSGFTIMNQFTEIKSINEVAELMQYRSRHLKSPRNESDTAKFQAKNSLILNNISNFQKIESNGLTELVNFFSRWKNRSKVINLKSKAKWKSFN